MDPTKNYTVPGGVGSVTDIGLGDFLQSQLQAQVSEQRKQQQNQNPGQSGDVLTSLMNGVATQSMFGKVAGFGQ